MSEKISPQLAEIFKGIYKDKPGVLRTMKFSEEENDILLQYLEKTYNTDVWTLIYNIFDEDAFLMLLDLLSGKTIKVPKRVEIQKIGSYIKIYAYLQRSNFEEASYRNASKIFNKRVNALKRIVTKIDRVMETPEQMAQRELEKKKEKEEKK